MLTLILQLILRVSVLIASIFGVVISDDVFFELMAITVLIGMIWQEANKDD